MLIRSTHIHIIQYACAVVCMRIITTLYVQGRGLAVLLISVG